MQRSECQSGSVGEYKRLIYDVLCFAMFCGLTVSVYKVYMRTGGGDFGVALMFVCLNHSSFFIVDVWNKPAILISN